MSAELEPLAWLWWIPALPFLGSVLCGIVHLRTLRARAARPGESIDAPLAGWIGVGAVALSFALSVAAFLGIRSEEQTVLQSSAWRWIPAGDLTISLRMVVDRLSGAMALVVTGVGALIHVYATGYMKGDRGYAKFFAYLNLFVAAMLVLILGSNLVGLFVGWEGVGLCSYLLIGFWYDREDGWPAEAGQKAFVMNRIGDASFLLGMFLLAVTFGTLDLAELNASILAEATQGTRGGLLATAALLLFGGACGKSAQLPLFPWLPDAMAGPTPVSALIHAATMVTSGIYLVVRLNPLFAASELVLFAIAAVGALTALVAGSAALVQRDLKKVLAYSTVSQLGYMFLGLGSGAFVAAFFHVVTHAFFKALLFLAAGSVIHGMHDEQDMHRLGGLRRHLPRTFPTFLAGAAALSGLPLLSGFFSKDEILARAFAAGGPWWLLWLVGVFTAGLTAFYTWRMVALTFFGPERFDHHRVHPHESPPSMTVPLAVLAVLSVLGGLLGLPAVLRAPHALEHWLEPVVAGGNELLAARHGGHVPHLSAGVEWLLLALGAAIALYFSDRGFHLHRHGLSADEAFARERPVLSETLRGAWGIDRAYATGVVLPVKALALFVAAVIDQLGIDGLVDATARGARGLGERVRSTANGSIAGYGLWMGSSTAVIALLWMWLG